MVCIEIAYNPRYLMRLFPRILIGITLEWFAHLPTSIRTWGELAEKFVKYFTFNIDNEITISTLFHTTQEDGENFVTFFQRWRGLASRCPVEILEKQKVVMFIENHNSNLKHDLRVQCCTSFSNLVEKCVILEKYLIDKGEINISNKNTNTQIPQMIKENNGLITRM